VFEGEDKGKRENVAPDRRSLLQPSFPLARHAQGEIEEEIGGFCKGKVIVTDSPFTFPLFFFERGSRAG